jgi:hypothetical protein
VGLGQHTLLGIVVGLCGGPRATHFTAGYCCWVMWGLGQHNLLGIVVGTLLATHYTWCWLCGASGNIFYWVGVYVGYCSWLCCASGNTLYWVLLLVYEGHRTTHFTGYCCGLCEVSGNTLYWTSLGHQWVQNNVF